MAKAIAVKSAHQGPTALLVERRSLVVQAAQILRQGILDGRFLPGSRLIETWLAEQMQLSRGTVRAALRELTHEGLVRAIPYTGWEVAELTIKDARELCTIRAALEGLAARLAAEAISPEKVEKLNAVYGRLAESAQRRNRRQCVDNDIALHKTMFELTCNDQLIDFYERIEHQIRLFVAFSGLRSEFEDFVTWHAPLVKSISDGDADAAERIAKENAQRNGRELVAQLERNSKSARASQSSDGETKPSPRTRRNRG